MVRGKTGQTVGWDDGCNGDVNVYVTTTEVCTCMSIIDRNRSEGIEEARKQYIQDEKDQLQYNRACHRLLRQAAERSRFMKWKRVDVMAIGRFASCAYTCDAAPTARKLQDEIRCNAGRLTASAAAHHGDRDKIGVAWAEDRRPREHSEHNSKTNAHLVKGHPVLD